MGRLNRREKCERCWQPLGDQARWSFVWCSQCEVGAALHLACAPYWDCSITAERAKLRGEPSTWPGIDVESVEQCAEVLPGVAIRPAAGS